MREDRQKLQATQRSGRKDQPKDLDHPGQLRAASRGHDAKDADDPRDTRRIGDRSQPTPDRTVRNSSGNR